jgi:hypothetical protein
VHKAADFQSKGVGLTPAASNRETTSTKGESDEIEDEADSSYRFSWNCDALVCSAAIQETTHALSD